MLNITIFVKLLKYVSLTNAEVFDKTVHGMKEVKANEQLPVPDIPVLP